MQVEVGLPTSKLVDAGVTMLGLDSDQVMGKLLRLWSACMTVRCGMTLGERSDSWIEEVVAWRGQPGLFARFVREKHLDGDAIRDWHEKYGKLERIREAASELKRSQRSRSKQRPVDGPPDSPGDSLVDGPPDSPPDLSPTIHSVVKEPRTTKEPVRRDAVAQFAHDEFDFGPFADIVEGFLRSQQRVAAIMATLRMHKQGELGHEKATDRELGLAVQQYAASATGGFNAKYFRGFVKDAKQAVVVVENRQRNTAEQRTIDLEARASAQRAAEEAEGDQLLTDFERENPDRFAELKKIADNQIPKKFTVAREVMIRGQLLALVREEALRAS
ncbi:MAG TPA: hypothetical protein VL333_13160 [Candidatus Saccharimonadales bacterium]|nr:hypothetical protein [Candidatus Saccharimonadales bacterium]